MLVKKSTVQPNGAEKDTTGIASRSPTNANMQIDWQVAGACSEFARHEHSLGKLGPFSPLGPLIAEMRVNNEKYSTQNSRTAS